MDVQAYVGMIALVAGLGLSAREIRRHARVDAAMSLFIALQGALLLSASVMSPGWQSVSVLGGIIAASLVLRTVVSRLREKERAR